MVETVIINLDIIIVSSSIIVTIIIALVKPELIKWIYSVFYNRYRSWKEEKERSSDIRERKRKAKEICNQIIEELIRGGVRLVW